MNKWVVVGAGITGATFARLRAEAGDPVFVADQRDHVGGNCHDAQYEGRGLIHSYGPHIFHTNHKPVYDFLSRFTEWRPYKHQVKARVLGKDVPLPINLDSIEALFSAPQAKQIIFGLGRAFEGLNEISLAQLRVLVERDNDYSRMLQPLYEVVYNEVFAPYTEKQWGVPIDSVDPAVLRRVPIRLNRDPHYFTDTYQALPKEGYTSMFNRMLTHENIEVLRSADLSLQHILSALNGGVRVLYTGQLDELFGWCHGRLPYRSLEFTTHTGSPLPSTTLNLPKDPVYTRSTDQSALNNHPECDSHVITSETPGEYNPDGSKFNTPYYPVNNTESNHIYDLYAKRAEGLGILVGGRLGSFKYLNIDQACAQAMKLAKEV